MYFYKQFQRFQSNPLEITPFFSVSNIHVCKENVDSVHEEIPEDRAHVLSRRKLGVYDKPRASEKLQIYMYHCLRAEYT